MSLISILTPTIRPKGLDLVSKSIQRQTYDSWEWIICAPQALKREIEKVLNNKIPYTFLGNSPLKPGQFWDLNYSYNRMIKESKGSLLVSWQDNIYIPPEGLESFWTAYKDTNGQGCISGVGDQYKSLDAFGKPYNKIWLDPRKTTKYGSFYECNWTDLEWNWCAIPKQALIAIGGFCEELDFRGFGMDGYQVNERLNELGYKIFLDQSNESYSFFHDRSDYGGKENWNNYNNLSNGEYEKVKQEFKKKKEWPIMKYI
jgi:glycosyltransferase involved in cell wall biosynthesis